MTFRANGKCGVFLFLLFAAAFLLLAPTREAAAKPVEYVKVCSLYGAGYYYVPGTDTCIKLGGWVRQEGAVCGYRSGYYFISETSCPQRPDASSTALVGCRALGVSGFTEAGSDTCRTLRLTNMRTQTEYGTLRSYFAIDNTPQGSWGVDIGVGTGFNIYSPNTSFLRGRDTLLPVATRDDKRDLDLGGASGLIGVDMNIWHVAPNFVSGIFPRDTRFFVNTGIYWSPGSSRDQTVTGVNVTPQGTVNTKVEDNWSVPMYAGFSLDLKSTWGISNFGFLDNPRVRLGGGGTFVNRSISVSGRDTSGVAFDVTRTQTEFEPGFLVGLRGGYAGYNVGLDVINTFPCGIFATAQSGYASQTYKGFYDGGVNTTVRLTVSRDIVNAMQRR